MANATGGMMHLLIAEDDDDDFLLIREAIAEAHLTADVHRVEDGEKLMDFLRRSQTPGESVALPSLILLDLNMPKKSGREALAEIKSHPQLRKIPILALTTSGAKEDVLRCYELGVNSFVQKPLRFEEMVELFRVIDLYWFKTVKLPA